MSNSWGFRFTENYIKSAHVGVFWDNFSHSGPPHSKPPAENDPGHASGQNGKKLVLPVAQVLLNSAEWLSQVQVRFCFLRLTGLVTQ